MSCLLMYSSHVPLSSHVSHVSRVMHVLPTPNVSHVLRTSHVSCVSSSSRVLIEACMRAGTLTVTCVCVHVSLQTVDRRYSCLLELLSRDVFLESSASIGTMASTLGIRCTYSFIAFALRLPRRAILPAPCHRWVCLQDVRVRCIYDALMLGLSCLAVVLYLEDWHAALFLFVLWLVLRVV